MTPVGEVAEVLTTRETYSSAAELRILFLIDEIEAITEGGTERQILQLIRLAKRLGYEPRLAVLRGTEWLTAQRAGCPVYLANARSLMRLSGWRGCAGLIRWMRREQIAMVQTFFLESNIAGPILARLASVPIVMGSRRNLNQWQERPWWVQQIFRQAQRFANSMTDCIIGNSEGVNESISRVEGCPSARLRVAYNGIDLNVFSGIERFRFRARRTMKVSDDEILVGNISCMRAIKGVDQFVEAARIASAKNPKLRFVVVGDGAERPKIEEQIRRHGLSEKIYLAGAQDDVLPFLAAMDIAVLSSFAEGFSNSLLEYMASGLPIVATDVGGNREALGDTGILVPAGDPDALAEGILHLESQDARLRMGRAVRKRVERFSLRRAEERMEDIYGEMLLSTRKLRLKI